MFSRPDFLLVEEDPFLARKLSGALQSLDTFCVAAANSRQGRMHLGIHGEHLKMATIALSNSDDQRLPLIAEFRKNYPQLPLLVICSQEQLSQAVRFRSGNTDYIVKPFDTEQFLSTCQRMLQGNTALGGPDLSSAAATEVAMAREAPVITAPGVNFAKAGTFSSPVLVGGSREMAETLIHLEKANAQSRPVLIIGESGTGKQSISCWLHHNGHTRQGPLVTVDCAQGPEELYATLFGSSQTTPHNQGCLDLAANGTLLLENLDCAPPHVQAALLTYLETGSFRPEGTITPHHVQLRLLASTDADLAELVALGTFRQDLYFRLSEFPVRLPPLRLRKEDIPALSIQFLRRLDRPELAGFSDDCWPPLQEHDWPGNVAELRETVEQAAALCARGVILPQHLPALLTAGNNPLLRSLRTDLSLALTAWLDERIKCRPATYDSMLQELEGELLRNLLNRYKRKPTLLAEALNMNRNTLRKKLEINGLNKRQNRRSRPAAAELTSPDDQDTLLAKVS